MWSAYRKILEKENPDIIHLHNTHYFVSPLIIKRLSRLKPVVKFVHDARFFCPSLGKKVICSSKEVCKYPVGIKCFNRKDCYPFHSNGANLIENLHKFTLVSYELRVSKMLDRIIVGSRYMYDELVRNRFAGEKISIIPCYTNKVFDDTEEINEEKKLIMYIGRIERGKGIQQFINALTYIKDQQWQVEIIGDGSFMDEAEEMVEKFGFKERIKFLGMLSDREIDKCYQRCRMVVLPSIVPESFGLIGIEAMAFGKTTVAFDSGGIREWLVDGETGFLIERGNIKKMANKIYQILEDEQLTAKMGKIGMECVEKFYRKDLHLKKIFKVYEEAINKRMGGRLN
jgi:glycosyltransferase involved in cell wall biosynthesis